MTILKRIWTRYRGTIGYLILAAAMIFGFVQRESDVNEQLIQLCRLGNEFRSDLVKSRLDETSDLIAASMADRTPAPTTAEEQAYQRRIQSYKDRRLASLKKLQPVKCEVP